MSDHITKISLWHQHLYSKSNKSEWAKVINQCISVATSKRFLPREYKHSTFFPSLNYDIISYTKLRSDEVILQRIKSDGQKESGTQHHIRTTISKKNHITLRGGNIAPTGNITNVLSWFVTKESENFFAEIIGMGVPAASMFPPNHQKIEMIT